MPAPLPVEPGSPQLDAPLPELLRRLTRLPGAACLPDAGGLWLAAQPDEVVRAEAGEDPFPSLESRWLAAAAPGRPGLGWAGALTYEAGRAVEQVPGRVREQAGLPRLLLAHYPAAVRLDDRGAGVFGDVDRARAIVEVLSTPLTTEEERERGGRGVGEVRRDLDDAAYRSRFASVHDAITAGEVYQVNLTSALRGRWEGHPVAFFLRLLGRPPWPAHAAYLDAGDLVLASASPELLLGYDPRSRRAVTGPIKGTTRSTGEAAEDARLAARLAADPKERAEHVMIVDLARNDLGRVARPGSVRPERLFDRLDAAAVQHLVTRVGCVLEQGHSPVDLLRAVFPGGSVTGAPKVAAMALIDALEVAPRGFYCGALGRFGPDGSMHLGLPIRTATLTRESDGSWEVVHPAGGGLVADSTADGELAELELKATRLREALAP